MLRHITGILMILCLLLATAGHTQAPENSDAEETPSSSAPSAQEERPDADQDTDDGGSRAPPEESFSPTEQISEDLSVPFPVDI